MTEARRIFDPVLWLDNLRVVNKEGAFTVAEKELIEFALYKLQHELKMGQHEQSDMASTAKHSGRTPS